MARLDTGTQFWLRYTESAGGAWEHDSDSVLVLLPPRIQEAHGLAEELRITADADVAREDGATLLAQGHPLLTEAAERVLADGDVGVIRLSRPAPPAPDTAKLLDAAREQFPVDHGRIDATGGATTGIRSILRVGALVSYDVSADEHYQEQMECWVDISSRRVLNDLVVERVSHAARAGTEPPGGTLPGASALGAALAHTHEVLGRRAHDRRTSLSRQTRDAYARELERTSTYYDEALESLDRRKNSAAADRVAGLDARIDSTRAERERRLAEVAEKYQPQHVIRPFRLHLLQVPVLGLPVDVRRGERRYPLTLDWFQAAGTFADLRCPHCDDAAPLVAAKTRLGCVSCLPSAASPATARPARATPTPATPARTTSARTPTPAPAARSAGATTAGNATAAATPKPKPESQPQPKAGKASAEKSRRTPSGPPAPTPPPSLDKIGKAGDRLVKSLWNMVATGDRRLKRSYAPHTPAATLHHLCGAPGPLHILGISDAGLASFSSSRSEPSIADPSRFVIAGAIQTASGRSHDYAVSWRFHDGAPLIEELLPFQYPDWPSLPRGIFARRWQPAAGALPDPAGTLDPVGRALWERALPECGWPLFLRMLTAWMRIPDRALLRDQHGRSVLAAGIDRLVSYRSQQRGATYAHVAARYRVDSADVRAVNALLQRRLKLSATCIW